MTPNEKPWQPFQQRVVDEKHELDFKRDRLDGFTKGDTFKTVPADEQNRLMEQLRIMNEYSSILAERIAHFVN